MLKPLSALLVIAGLLSGCATKTTLPPLSDQASARENPGQIIWHDLATRDLAVAQAFYGQLFNWDFEKIGSGAREYTLIRNRGEIIGGMFKFEDGEKDNAHGEWLLNLATSDIEATVQVFADNGGKIIEPPRDFPDRGRAAFIEDSQGALLILLDSAAGDPAPTPEVPLGGWLWHELWTHDKAEALASYQRAFGYETEAVDASAARNYHLLLKNGEPTAGILEMQTQAVRPHWVPFIRVQSVANTVATAKAMQANVILEPDPDIRDGKVALLQGPTGEPLVVQEFDFN